MGHGEKMKILITGGLGYVGGRLASFLKEKDSQEIYLTTRRRRNLPPWTKNFDVVECELLNPDSVAQCLNNVQPDTIIHLAAMNQQECNKNPGLAFDVNAKGTLWLLDCAIQTAVKRFIYFSTFQVYGKLNGEIMEETLCQPNNFYSMTKRAGEDIVRFYNSQHQIQTLILRLANAYGYPVDKDVNVWHLVFNSFCRKSVEQGKIIIESNQYRDFIAMEDAVRAVYHLLFTVPDKWQDGVFNLGGECCLSVSEVAQKVTSAYQKNFGAKVTIEDHSEAGGYKPFRYNIDKLKGTGFRLKSDMEREIVKTIELCRTFQEAGR